MQRSPAIMLGVGGAGCRNALDRYGGRLQSKDALAFFDSGSGSPYMALMSALREFVVAGAIPVPLAEAIEVMAILEAGEQSLASGTVVDVLEN